MQGFCNLFKCRQGHAFKRRQWPGARTAIRKRRSDQKQMKKHRRSIRVQMKTLRHRSASKDRHSEDIPKTLGRRWSNAKKMQIFHSKARLCACCAGQNGEREREREGDSNDDRERVKWIHWERKWERLLCWKERQKNWKDGSIRMKG